MSSSSSNKNKRMSPGTSPRSSRRNSSNTSAIRRGSQHLKSKSSSTGNLISNTTGSGFSGSFSSSATTAAAGDGGLQRQDSSSDDEETYKVVILGDPATGKTSFTIHFMVHEYIQQVENKRRRYTLNTTISQVERDMQLKKIKMEELEYGLQAFNHSQRQGLRYLCASGIIPDTDEGRARFLLNNKDISPVKVGQLFGDPSSLPIIREYMKLFDMKRMKFVEAIRRIFSSNFILPKEANQIDRIIEAFATEYAAQQRQYLICNPEKILAKKKRIDADTEGGSGDSSGSTSSTSPRHRRSHRQTSSSVAALPNQAFFSHTDSFYVLAYAVLLLNTDLHNDLVKNKISREAFKEQLLSNPEFLKGVLESFSCLEEFEAYVDEKTRELDERKRQRQEQQEKEQQQQRQREQEQQQQQQEQLQEQEQVDEQEEQTAENTQQESQTQEEQIEVQHEEEGDVKHIEDEQQTIALNTEEKANLTSIPESPVQDKPAGSIASVVARISRRHRQNNASKENAISTIVERYFDLNNELEMEPDLVERRRELVGPFLDFVYDDILHHELELSSHQEKAAKEKINTSNEFNDPSQDMRLTGLKDCHSRKITLGGRSIKVNVVDDVFPGGQEIFSQLEHNYLRQADAFILLYAINDRRSFQNIAKVHFKKVFRTTGGEKPIFLVGNKIDLEREWREVTYDQGEMMARKYLGGVPFFETSTDHVPLRFDHMQFDQDGNMIETAIDPNSDDDDFGVKSVVEIFQRLIRRARNARFGHGQKQVIRPALSLVSSRTHDDPLDRFFASEYSRSSSHPVLPTSSSPSSSSKKDKRENCVIS